MLSKWILALSIVLHMLVSPIGVVSNKVELGYTTIDWDSQGWSEFVGYAGLDAINGVLFPYTFLRAYDGELILSPGFVGFEWSTYSQIGMVLIGVTLSWMFIMCMALIVRVNEVEDWRREFRLLGRCVVLSCVPFIVYLQVVRAGFGIHVSTGMTISTNWDPVMFLISLLVFVVWQQALWTHAVRKVWNIKRSWAINIGGCFGSCIGGIVFLYYML